MEKTVLELSANEPTIGVGSFVRTSEGELGMVDSVFNNGPVTGYGFVTSDGSSWTEKIIPFNDVVICTNNNEANEARVAALNFYKNETEHLRWRLRHEWSNTAERKLSECMAFLDYLQPFNEQNIDDAIKHTEP